MPGAPFLAFSARVGIFEKWGTQRTKKNSRTIVDFRCGRSIIQLKAGQPARHKD